MFEPERRALLLDTLRPPAGMIVDRAVGTTFSLDLEALLMAPVTFALFDTRLAESGNPTTLDPLSLLEAVRRHAGRIDLFCQTGQIGLPENYQPIVSYLEESIHSATAPSPHHIFHPKVWVLRYTTPDGAEVSYRLLVLSRNLTFDRSWDTVVQLDGMPTSASIPANQPLADFVLALAGRTVGELPPDRSRAMADLAGELRSVEWELPEGVEEVGFLVGGLDRPVPELDAADRLVILAPFLSPRTLARLGALGKRAVLVSRPESLDRIPMETLETFEEVLQLATDSVESDEAEPGPPSEVLSETAGRVTSGLHAKLFVADRGGRSTILSGSMNATDAGFGGNVELVVEMSGSRSRLGVEKLLGTDSEPSHLRSLLTDYMRTEPDPEEATDEEKAALDLDRLGRRLASMAYTARVDQTDEDSDHYRLRLVAEDVLPTVVGVSVRCWPITLKPDTAAVAMRMGDAVDASYPGLSLTALTSFFCLELIHADPRVTHRIVINARLVGAPEDRHQRVLTAQLRSKGDVLRYLLLLLADVGDVSPAELAAVLGGGGAGDGQGSVPRVPLFETMVRALARHPEALDHINRLVCDLQSTEEGRDLLPDGLDAVWPAIWEARQEVGR